MYYNIQQVIFYKHSYSTLNDNDSSLGFLEPVCIVLVFLQGPYSNG